MSNYVKVDEIPTELKIYVYDMDGEAAEREFVWPYDRELARAYAKSIALELGCDWGCNS